MRRLATALALAAVLSGCGGSGGTAPAEPAAPLPAENPPAESAPADTGLATVPAIVVEEPAPNDRVTSPVTVSGNADVFEANVTAIVLDADGNELARDFTTATCGTGCRGAYAIDLAFAVDSEQPGTIVVQDDDAAGTGTPPHVVRVPVTLLP